MSEGDPASAEEVLPESIENLPQIFGTSPATWNTEPETGVAGTSVPTNVVIYARQVNLCSAVECRPSRLANRTRVS